LNFGIRTIVAAILTPLAIFVIHRGGWIYQIFILILLGIAAWEYLTLLKKIDYQPASILVMLGVLIFGISRAAFQFSHSAPAMTAFVFLIAAWHIFQFEKEDTQPAGDFGASLSVLIYVGFLGAYLISLRDLPEGKWWTFLTLPSVWVADTGAYLIGSWIGKHKLAPKTSPHKTWEGYLAGLFFGSLSGVGFLLFFNRVFDANLTITILQAALLALALSALSPLGDLTESLIKRTAGEKDSGTIFPGHGGAFDRIDSMFWTAPIAYYLILFFFI
jgi:phosphatidate cytidylyltransferase